MRRRNVKSFRNSVILRRDAVTLADFSFSKIIFRRNFPYRVDCGGDRGMLVMQCAIKFDFIHKHECSAILSVVCWVDSIAFVAKHIHSTSPRWPLDLSEIKNHLSFRSYKSGKSNFNQLGNEWALNIASERARPEPSESWWQQYGFRFSISWIAEHFEFRFFPLLVEHSFRLAPRDVWTSGRWTSVHSVNGWLIWRYRHFGIRWIEERKLSCELRSICASWPNFNSHITFAAIVCGALAYHPSRHHIQQI